jgi:monoamine oxidase
LCSPLIVNLENLFCAGTYKTILAKVAEPAVKYTRLEFLTKAVRFESLYDRVNVQNESGAVQEYDEVVVTSPLGWLKRNLTSFSPPLPERLSQAIENIGYGSLEKAGDCLGLGLICG